MELNVPIITEVFKSVLGSWQNQQPRADQQIVDTGLILKQILRYVKRTIKKWHYHFKMSIWIIDMTSQEINNMLSGIKREKYYRNTGILCRLDIFCKGIIGIPPIGLYRFASLELLILIKKTLCMIVAYFFIFLKHWTSCLKLMNKIGKLFY